MATTPSLPHALETAHPLLLSALHDRVLGVLVGSALGDAIGLYTEFLSAAAAATAYPSATFTLHPAPTPFHRDFHRLKHHQGDWTDDTDHALLILLSYLHHGALLPNDFAARLKIWVEQGLRALDALPLGLGNLVGRVVRSEGFVDAPERAARKAWEDRGRVLAPNGSLMRCHPLGVVCLAEGEEAAFEAAVRFSETTHVDPRCVVACVIGVGMVRGLARGEVSTEEEVDGLVRRAVDWYLMNEEDELDLAELNRHVTAPETLADLKLDEASAIGYVYKALGSGILLLRLAIRRMKDGNKSMLVQQAIFEDLITQLIMCGGDADTNACFAGSLLGAYLGYGALPPHWKHGLRHGKWLIEKSEALCQLLHIIPGVYDGKADKDTHLDGGRGFLSSAEMEERFTKRQYAILEDMAADAKARAAPKRKSAWGGLFGR